MARIRGTAVKLYIKTQVGTDDFNEPVYELSETVVENVLIGEPTTIGIPETINLTGRKAQYVLAIPKGDANDWENAIIEFFGQKWKSFGIPVQGIESNIPLDWNKKVWVERYE